MKKGFKVNSLTFIKEVDPKIRINGAKRRRALFQCDCGVIKEYDYSSVKNGVPKQCIKCGHVIAAKKKITHGLIKHPLYSKWQDMKKRCYNKKVDRYKNYGALGVIVCDKWKNDFKAFYDWSLSNGWAKGLQIDRKDVYGNYTPENCQYITQIEQGFNKKNTFYITYKGNKISLAKFLYYQNASNKYRYMWQWVKDGKDIEILINKYGLDLPF